MVRRSSGAAMKESPAKPIGSPSPAVKSTRATNTDRPTFTALATPATVPDAGAGAKRWTSSSRVTGTRGPTE